MKHKFHRPILNQILIVLRAVFGLLPYRVGFYCGAATGRLAYYFLHRDRQTTLSNLRTAFENEKPESDIRRIARSMFGHYGKLVAEWLLIDKILPRLNEFVSAEGYERFDRLLREGTGAVVVIAHLGNWEIMGGYTVSHGYPSAVVARKIYYEKYDEYMVRMRRKMGIRTFYRHGRVRPMLEFLKSGGFLGFVADQDVDSIQGNFVDFFGKNAYTPTAPVRFARAAQVPIIPMFIIRRGIRHHIVVEEPITIEQGSDKDQTVALNTERWVKIQENYIRRFPELWAWNHRRWKTICHSESVEATLRHSEVAVGDRRISHVRSFATLCVAQDDVKVVK